MTFWQENYAFIKDVYDDRVSKLNQIMDKIDKCIGEVLADKLYTSNEFKKVMEQFASLNRQLELPDTKDWLRTTKETLLSDRSSAENEDETKKLNAVLSRYDETMPRVNETKQHVNCLWKAYQFTDELAPLTEWIEEMRTRSCREILSDGASKTEELIEKQEKYLDQLDKKKRSYVELKTRGEKLLSESNSAKFLGQMEKFNELWRTTNKLSEDKLFELRDNMENWEKYEKERDNLLELLDQADQDFENLKRVYDVIEAPKSLIEKEKRKDGLMKEISVVYGVVMKAYDTLCRMIEDDKRNELDDEIQTLKDRFQVGTNMSEKLDVLKVFNDNLNQFNERMNKLESWLDSGRSQVEDLINPKETIEPEERVIFTMELQGLVQDEIEKENLVVQFWNENLQPEDSEEYTDDFNNLNNRIEKLSSDQNQLLEQIQSECAKYGEDIKHLADFTSGHKKFESWAKGMETEMKGVMKKPSNLRDAQTGLQHLEKRKGETDDMKQILTMCHASAQKMTLHEEPDNKHKKAIERLNVMEKICNERITKMKSMVEVWKKQAETAELVTAALNNKSEQDGENSGGEMKLEDLEKHLETLKKTFIEKQKLMEALKSDENKT